MYLYFGILAPQKNNFLREIPQKSRNLIPGGYPGTGPKYPGGYVGYPRPPATRPFDTRDRPKLDFLATGISLLSRLKMIFYYY